MQKEDLSEKINNITDMLDNLINLNPANVCQSITSYKVELEELKFLIGNLELTENENLLVMTYYRALSIMEKVSFDSFIVLTSKDNDSWDYRTFVASVMLKTDLYEGFEYDYISSSHIGEYMTAGFGKCNDIGDFTFPLPVNIEGRQYVVTTIVDDYYTLYSK